MKGGPEPGAVVLGAQAMRSHSSRGRGLGRYAYEYSRALASEHPGLVAWTDDDPEQPRPLSGRPALYHVLSPFEQLPLDRVWPVWARDPRVALAVTLHDLVPLVFPETYLGHPLSRLAYLTRLQLVKRADAILAISEAAARDAVTWLGVEESRVHVAYEDCAPLFRPPGEAREQVLAVLRGTLPELRASFCLYVGGEDPRKNMTAALAAFARLDPAQRAEHQLVIACRLSGDQQRRLAREAGRLGISGDTLFTGEVDDDTLLRLYQGCEVFVFPSLYEGFGLPVLEAMRCGAPVIASNLSSLPELVTEPEAAFDPARPEAIAAVLSRALGDAGFRDRLRRMAAASAARFSWHDTVTRSLAGYRAAWRRRAQLWPG